ncbi:MAG: hypothetical protein Q8Q11_03465 [bacterium]|nr:hypothetical protein [bacterium]MDZ4248232.1 hypothetical protein [Patescibacteria group bacterium]
MSTEETVEHPFATAPEGREIARSLTAEQLADLEREHAVRKHIQGHLSGNTPIGEALSFFYGESRKAWPGDSAVHDLSTADRVVVDFFTDTGRYCEAWEQGLLRELVMEESAWSNADRFGAEYVGDKLTKAFDAVFAAEQGDV